MDIFYDYFEIDLTKDNSLLKKNLLGNEIGMAPRDLLSLYFYIEENFKITIPQEAIAKKQFTYFNGICQIIKKQLSEKVICYSSKVFKP